MERYFLYIPSIFLFPMRLLCVFRRMHLAISSVRKYNCPQVSNPREDVVNFKSVYSCLSIGRVLFPFSKQQLQRCSKWVVKYRSQHLVKASSKLFYSNAFHPCSKGVDGFSPLFLTASELEQGMRKRIYCDIQRKRYVRSYYLFQQDLQIRNLKVNFRNSRL